MKNITIKLAVAVLSFSLIDTAQGHEREDLPANVRAAFSACATQLGLELDGKPPAEEQRAKMDSCLAEKGVFPPKGGPGGVRPSREKMEAMKSCLSAAGLSFPERPKTGELDESTRAAFDACRDKIDGAETN